MMVSRFARYPPTWASSFAPCRCSRFRVAVRSVGVGRIACVDPTRPRTDTRSRQAVRGQHKSLQQEQPALARGPMTRRLNPALAWGSKLFCLVGRSLVGHTGGMSKHPAGLDPCQITCQNSSEFLIRPNFTRALAPSNTVKYAKRKPHPVALCAASLLSGLQ